MQEKVTILLYGDPVVLLPVAGGARAVESRLSRLG
jgi:hypothetical protein